MQEIEKKLDEIIKMMRVQTNLLDSLHKLFNQFNKDYLIETQKDSGFIDKID
jgi:hypothetical protein